MHRLTRISLLAAGLLVFAILLLRHQQADPDRAASPDAATLTPTADAGPSPAASPHEVMAGPEPATTPSLHTELKLASLQQARDQGLPVRLPVPHHQTGQVERVNSYAADQVSATGILTGTHLRFRLNRLGQTTSLELQDAATGRFQTWLTQGDAPTVLMPAAEGEDLALNCEVHEPEPEQASAAGGVGADFRAVHPPPVDVAAHAPILAQSPNLAQATTTTTPVIDVAVGWFPAAIRGSIPELLRARNLDSSADASREFLINQIHASFDLANEIMENSEIDVRFNPLMISALPESEYLGPDNGVLTPGSGADFLNALGHPSDGRMDNFLREATTAGADIFTAVVGGDHGIGGIAFTPGEHSVVSVGNTLHKKSTYAHEWGHNMRCLHDRADVMARSPSQYRQSDHNYGWTFEELPHNPAGGNREVTHGTVMVSLKDELRPYFSNPDLKYVHPMSGETHDLGNRQNDNRRVVRFGFRRLVNRNTVPVAPAITSQPASSAVDEGDAASFSVTATGGGLTYQWKKDGDDLSGATSATYEIASVALTDAGDYTVVVTNSVDTVTSDVATLTVVVAPAITSQPASSTVDEGDAASFSVTATGGALTYQWKKDGNDLTSATAATYEIASVIPADAGDYTVVVTNSVDTVTSQAATLTVVVAPAITSQPASSAVDDGDAASFSVVATGTAPLTYQWRKDSNAIVGASSATYEISRAGLTDAGAYSVAVSNSAGTVTSSAATLTVNAVPPAITGQPTALTVDDGQPATFSVTATGTAPLTYQWRKDGSAIAGATAATYEIARAALTDAGDYSVAVTNSAGTVTSSAATLTVNAVPPAITGQPTAVTVDDGEPATFSVTVTGTAPLTYQWRKDSNAIVGASSATYEISRAGLTDAGAYSVAVSNSAGTATSSAATLTVNAVPPAITGQPTAVTVDDGQPATFSVTVTGTTPLTYQWRKDGNAIVGASSATYEIARAALTDAGDYSVAVTNSAGTVTSSAATLTVNAVAPAITTQPSARTVAVDGTATFSVTATGTAPLTYQWRKDGSAIAGATSSTYTLSGAVAADAGTYSVVVSNVASDVTSSAVILAVIPLRLTSFTVSPAFRSSNSMNVTIQASAKGGDSVGIEYVLRAPDGTDSRGSVVRVGGGEYATDIPLSNSPFMRGEWEIASVTLTAVTLTGDVAVTYSYEDLAAADFDNGFFAGPPPTFKVQPPDVSAVAGFWMEVNVQVNHTRVQDRADETRTFPVNAWHLVLSDRTLQSDTSVYTNFADAVAAKLLFGPITASDAGNFRIRATNPFGSVDSASRKLTVVAAVSERAVHVGARTILSAPSTTIGVFRYQWLKDGFDIPGATDSNYAIDPIRLADAGLYSLRIKDSYLRSSLVHRLRLTVSHPPFAPAITSQPVAMSVVEGDSASFGVRASGTAPLSYQWRKDGNAIAGATAATYVIANTALADAGSYSVVVSNAVGSATSAAAILTVTEAIVAPAITSQPMSMSVVEGDDTSFRVVATGTAPLSWQWRKDGRALGGATAARYEIADATLADAGDYSVVVTNSAGSATSAAAILTVTETIIAPAITSHPASATVEEGDAASFRVIATGTAPLTYQWRRNGRNIAGATAATHAITGTRLADAGAYSVVVSNAAGSVTSSVATLAVTAAIIAPAITSQPATKSVVVGTTASFSVSATGTAPLTYQWRKNGIAIAGATATTYAIASAAQADAGPYSVVVSNAAGSVTSSVATLTVSQTAIAPVVTTPPAALTVGVGGTANFGVSVSGTFPFTWQWRKDGSDIPNATETTYVITNTQLADAGDYSVTVTNEAGSVTSAAATLTVTQSSVLSNLSVRIPLREAQVLVMGAVVSHGSKRLLIRAAGPALDTLNLGLEGLSDPQITLYDPAGGEIGENDDWEGALADTFAAAGAFPFPPNSKDSAYMLEEARGAFTVHVSGKDGSGIVLVEAYDRSTAFGPRLTNVSARNLAGTGDDTFIAGFVISGTVSSRVLIRVIGPTLGEPPYLISGYLEDPAMTVFDGDNEAIESNDDWDPELAETFESVGAFALRENSKDAALVVELDPGKYTVLVTGANEGVGEALIEVYEVRAP